MGPAPRFGVRAFGRSGWGPSPVPAARTPPCGRRVPARLQSLSAALTRPGAGPCREADLGTPTLRALRFSPYPRRSRPGMIRHNPDYARTPQRSGRLAIRNADLVGVGQSWGRWKGSLAAMR